MNLLNISLFQFLGRDSAITQLAARCAHKSFHTFVTPAVPISPEASRVTGICFDELQNVMTHHGETVIHVNPLNALLDFIQFLVSCGKDIVLIAHNNRKFDSVILFNHLRYFNLWSHFCTYVIQFADTLPFFRKLYPLLPNHKQETLVTNLLQETYSAHDASADCLYLQKLVLHSGNEEMLVNEFLFSSSQITSSGVQPEAMSLEFLCKTNVVSKHIASKLKNSSLSYHHLKTAYERDGYDGLFFLLSEKDQNGKTRITKSRNVIQKVFDHFHSL
ncbi:hypothetical protein FSP39_012484 [Pinctada imbricata]|uniref:Exonuclease domain-containing protein n=1 Tax=Pinctada imbricata TaxID=66713 RepID=A0AA88YN03_PINIB|nr:hypothetical protein FSP39_012484 [Pinctada imbricata]